MKWTNLDCIERRLSRFFDIYGRFISRHPWPFICFPFLLNVALSVGLLYRNEITDATYLYTPTDAQSKYERAVVHEKWPLVDGNYVAGRAITSIRECQSIVTSKDNGNILRAEYAEAINRLNLYIISEIKVRYRNRTYGYMDLCLHWEDSCHTNAQIGLVSSIYSSRGPPAVNLTYPISRFGSQPIYLGSSLGGVSVNSAMRIMSAKAWFLIYQLQFYPDNNSYVSGLWEKEFKKALLAYSDPLIDVTVFHSQTLADELERNAEHLTPRFVISFLLLAIFAILCTMSFVDGTCYIDWTKSKPILAMAGMIGAGIGVSSAIGLLNFCGMVYTQIVAVMPFLIVSVRLDNTFLMISAVRHTSPLLPVEERMGRAMSEAAVSITITVITDLFSFALGLATNIPAVQIFCLYTSIAVCTTFFNQLTILMSVLVLTLRMEEKGKHCIFTFANTVPASRRDYVKVSSRLFMLGSKRDLDAKAKGGERDDRSCVTLFFEEWYAPILMHPVMRGIVILWFCIYLGFSIWSCMGMREGLEPVNLLVSDSYAIPHYRALEKYFWKYGPEVQIVVNNAPDLSKTEEREKIMRMVRSFGESKHSLCPESIQFWLIELERFLNEWSLPYIDFLTTEDFYRSVRHFLALNTYERFRYDVQWGDPTQRQNENMIVAFRFTMGLRQFSTSVDQVDTVKSLRTLATNYSEYNVTTFNPVWLFVDQYQEILPNVLQEVVSGISVMVMIALMLIPHPLCSFWVAVTIASIDIGVLGLMTVWDLNLDAVSMITVIMSIGFSVDFSAHIAHAFVVSGQTSSVERAKTAIARMSWPILQGGLSTIIGVVVLADLDSYMVVAFFKTVLLVIILGVMHGILFLPVLLSVFIHKPKCCKRKRADASPTEQIVAPFAFRCSTMKTPSNSLLQPQALAAPERPRLPREGSRLTSVERALTYSSKTDHDTQSGFWEPTADRKVLNSLGRFQANTLSRDGRVVPSSWSCYYHPTL